MAVRGPFLVCVGYKLLGKDRYFYFFVYKYCIIRQISIYGDRK